MKLVAMFFVALCCTQPAAFGQTVVYPTGDAAQDVAAVRAAVGLGGTVLLKAADVAGNPRAFDFGDFPVSGINWNYFGSGYVALGTSGEIVPVPVGAFTFYVSLGNDVRLVGEVAGGATTTIQGGTIPVRNFAPQVVPGVGVQFVFGLGNLTIEGIRFTESALQSIYTTQLESFPEVRALMQTRGLDPHVDIRHDEFLDVQPAYGPFWYALAAVTDGPAGAVHVEDNVVRFTPGRWDAAERSYEQIHGLGQRSEIWEGLSIADLHDAGDVRRNQVQGVDVGVLVYFEGSDVVQISDNWIELRPEGFVGISCQANHTYLVERNTVIARGANPDGIILEATDPDVGINHSTVRHNHVVLDGSEFGGISLFGAGVGNYIAENRVEGSAAYALGLVADFFAPEGVATANAFAGNQISQFTPRDSSYYGTGAHVFFDVNTRRNVLVGKSGIVKDLGQDNSVTGSRVRGQGPASTLPAALAAKRSLLHLVRP